MIFSQAAQYWDCYCFFFTLFKMNMTYGQRLKSARDAARLTQTELAERSRVSQAHISDLETSNNKGSTATARFAYVLGVNAIWLSDEIGQREVSPVHLLALQILALPPESREHLLAVIRPYLKQSPLTPNVALHHAPPDFGVDLELAPTATPKTGSNNNPDDAKHGLPHDAR